MHDLYYSIQNVSFNLIKGRKIKDNANQVFYKSDLDMKKWNWCNDYNRVKTTDMLFSFCKVSCKSKIKAFQISGFVNVIACYARSKCYQLKVFSSLKYWFLLLQVLQTDLGANWFFLKAYQVKNYPCLSFFCLFQLTEGLF